MGLGQLSSLAVGLLAASVMANPMPAPAPAPPSNLPHATKHNDFSCKSTSHPNPVVLLHGLGATYYEDLNFLEYFLQSKGFCTFSLTYGAYKGFPLVGGFKPIAESSQEIAAFIKEVKQKTGADKIDLVGHSEGGFQTLYTPKFGGVSQDLERLVAIAPPTHGTTFADLYKLAYLLGDASRAVVGDLLRTFGCGACDDLGIGGAAIAKLNDGKPIKQPGNKLTIITSKHDELVTPTTTAFLREDGVNNIYVQDYCALDPVGHIGEAYDLNVWNLVLNSLEDKVGRKFFCVIGSPGK